MVLEPAGVTAAAGCSDILPPRPRGPRRKLAGPGSPSPRPAFAPGKYWASVYHNAAAIATGNELPAPFPRLLRPVPGACASAPAGA